MTQLFSKAPDAILIAENGAYATAQDRVLAHFSISHPLASEITESLKRVRVDRPFGLVWSGPKSAYVDRFSAPLLDLIAQYHPVLEQVDDLRDASEEPLRISVLAPKTTSPALLERIVATANQCRVGRSTPIWTDITNPATDKGAALAELQRSLGVSPAETVVFGDYPNDVPMFRHAGTSFAMANAHPDVLALADRVAPANTEYGVLRELEKILDED